MYHGLPFATAACLCIKIDKVFRQCFFAFDFKLCLRRLQITIPPCPPADESLDLLRHSGYNTPQCLIFTETTRSKPTHDLLTDLLQHCQNRHLPCCQELSVKGFRDIGCEMTISFASEVQIGPVLRIPGLIKEPVNTVGVQCFHVRHTFLKFGLSLRSGSCPEQIDQIWVLELFVHVVLEMT
jgi:hypothetical protein